MIYTSSYAHYLFCSKTNDRDASPEHKDDPGKGVYKKSAVPPYL